ncbi:MAG: DUF2231 domain-containing protein [Actinomycetota bacterium]
MAALPINHENLPYPDPIHPIIVHFVIAMVLFAFLCDAMGYFTRNHRLYEVGFWNLLVAAVAIFLAVIFGEFEAGLANVYGAAKGVLDLHTIAGWSLSAILVAIAAWRFVIRNRDPLRIPVAYLGFAAFLSCLVCFQTYLGTRLVWVYGLHVEPVVQAMKQGVFQ